jgi:hypothetical protein
MDVKPGALTPADHERIFELAELGWKAHRIASAIGKNSSTVQWFMYVNGLDAPNYRMRGPYVRNGRTVTPFDKAEDDFIQRLRVDGLPQSAIKDATNKRFGRNRSDSTIMHRLVMLAAREDA